MRCMSASMPPGTDTPGTTTRRSAATQLRPPATVAPMPIARYKDLCIDATDARALTGFWAGMLGWEAHPHDDGGGCIRVGEQVMIWVNEVPEPTSVKNRIHLDVRAESLDAALAAGATVADEQPRWTVMKDPDGQEFCIFEREAPITDRFYELVWDVTGDSDDAHRVAEWWAGVLGRDGRAR